MKRIATTHGGADALVRPAERSSACGSSLRQTIGMPHSIGKTGKGTTSVVPIETPTTAASAAEGTGGEF